MVTISILLAIFVALGLTVRKYNGWTRLLMAGVILVMLAFLYLT